MDVRNKRIAVLGLNQEGLTFLKALRRLGAKISGFGTPASEEAKEKFIKELGGDVPLTWSPDPALDFSDFDVILYTTRFGQYGEALDRAKERGIPVYWDLDFVTTFLKAPIIGITGTNGKSTTLTMLRQMLEAGGYKVTATGGDFDPWGARLTDVGKVDFHLMELSSQRLENSAGFHPHIAILLNVFLTHQARHKEGIPGYYAAKAKIFTQQTPEDFLIHEGVAGNIRELVRRCNAQAKPILFSLDRSVEGPGIYRKENQLVWQGLDGGSENYLLSKPQHRNPVLMLNFMAAIAAAKLVGVSGPVVQQILDEFTGLSHRMEKVRSVSKIHFVDDARSTNLGATIWALSAFEQPVWLIMGGEPDPGSDFAALRRILPKKAKGVFCVGMKREALKEMLQEVVPVQIMGSLEDAVKNAYRSAQPEEVVLFSPGCHPDIYMQGEGNKRGEEFQQIVQSLPEIQRTFRPQRQFTRI